MVTIHIKVFTFVNGKEKVVYRNSVRWDKVEDFPFGILYSSLKLLYTEADKFVEFSIIG